MARQQRGGGKSMTSGPAEARKKPYRPPKLTVYGDLRKITRVKGRTHTDDPGTPPSKK